MITRACRSASPLNHLGRRRTPKMCLIMWEFAYHSIVRSRNHCVRRIPALGRSGYPRSFLGLRTPHGYCILISAAPPPNSLEIAQQSQGAEVVPGVSSPPSSRVGDRTRSGQAGADCEHDAKCSGYPDTVMPHLNIRFVQVILRLLITLVSADLWSSRSSRAERPAHPHAAPFHAARADPARHRYGRTMTLQRGPHAGNCMVRDQFPIWGTRGRRGLGGQPAGKDQFGLAFVRGRHPEAPEAE